MLARLLKNIQEYSIMKYTLLTFLGLVTLCLAQAQPQRKRGGQGSQPLFSFQSFDHSTGFPEASPLSPSDISSGLGAQLTSSATGSFQEETQRANEIHPRVEHLPLYKQSFPGVYVKGHAANSLNKFEPTRQVAHHHGPNYQRRRNVASSSPAEQGFSGNPYELFN